jgi:hypothetical protein
VGHGKAAERWLAKNTPAAYRDTIRVSGVFVEYRTSTLVLGAGPARDRRAGGADGGAGGERQRIFVYAPGGFCT